jgi:hypothetical protein
MIVLLKNKLKQLRQQLSLKLVAKVVAGFVAFYLLFAYFAVNPIAKKLIPRITEQSLASKASISSVAFDPFRLKATINDFSLATQSDQPLVQFKKLVVDFELSGMFDLAWKFKQIGILAPKIDLSISPNGQFNWDELIAKLNEDKAPPSDTIPSVIIEHIVVNQGQIQYADTNRDKPFKTTLTPLNFELEGLSTLPKDRGDYFISAAFAKHGGTLKWKGDMSVNPIASKGVVAVDGIKIQQVLQLVKGLDLPVAISGGELQTSFNYDFSSPESIPTLAVNNFTFSVRNVAGKLAQDGDVALDYAVLSAPSISFIQKDQPILHIDRLDFASTNFQLKQKDQLQVTLKDSAVSLPQLDFMMQEMPQLAFANANFQFSGLSVNQDNQFVLAVPQTNVNTVNFDLKENKIDVKEITLSNIQLGSSQATSKPLATLNKATVVDAVIALKEKKISAQSVLFSGFETSVIKQADNTLNWVKPFEDKQSPAKQADTTKITTETDAPAWTMALATVALDSGHIHIQDNSVPTPMVIDIENAKIETQGASLDLTKALPIKVAFKLKQGGQFSSKGQVWPAPFKADLGLRLSSLSLKPFAPYLNQVALLKLNGGAADLSGKLQVEQKQEFALNFNGKFDVKQLAVVKEVDDKPFLSWDHLRSDKLSVSLAPNQLKMSTLQVIKPSGRLIINPDKSVNLTQVLRHSAESSLPLVIEKKVEKKAASANADSLIKPAITAVAPQPTVPPKATPTKVAPSNEAFPVNIDAIRISDAQLEFADLSLTPQFGTNIHTLNGVVNGLSTKAGKVTQVEMDGKVDDYGSARISGSLQPFNVTDFMDIKLAFVNLEMNRLTPYSGKFAGRRIEAGKLSVDLAYKIKQQQILGTNKFVINKIKLGEKVESADAADLPLDLAIAILEDSNGVIDLDLPISGSLDDPSFSYSGIFWKAFRNVLTKIVTAPFRVLGKLFGGDGEDFDGIQFDAGVSEISPPELEKVANVSKALTKRQGLALGVVPSYNLALDTAAIKQATYRQQVVEEMGIQLEPGQKPGPIDLENEEVQSAVDALYNDLTNKGLLKRMVSKLQTPEEGHYEKAQTQLIASIEVTDADLTALAAARAEAIQAALLANGVSQDRVSILKMAGDKKGGGITTELKLAVKK